MSQSYRQCQVISVKKASEVKGLIPAGRTCFTEIIVTE